MPHPTLQPATPPRVSLALQDFIALTGALSMHIFVPALPGAARDLHVDAQTVQMAITIYILGLVVGQLVYGPIADVIGRRPAILGAMAIYIGGPVASGLAPSARFLAIARFVQALGGAWGLALSRVIVADTSRGTQATERIAILNMILLIGPGVAPILGAYIAEATGWRSIFLDLAACAICCTTGNSCAWPPAARSAPQQPMPTSCPRHSSSATTWA